MMYLFISIGIVLFGFIWASLDFEISGNVLFIFLVLFTVLIGVPMLVYSLIDKPVLKSPTKIEPTIELIINDNRVDTVYVYKNK